MSSCKSPTEIFIHTKNTFLCFAEEESCSSKTLRKFRRANSCGEIQGSSSSIGGDDETSRPITPNPCNKPTDELDCCSTASCTPAPSCSNSRATTRTFTSLSIASSFGADAESDEENAKHAPWRQLKQFASANQKHEGLWTTVMIRNIPNRYVQEWLLAEIQQVASCNFLHLPQAKRSDANLGYAFVNFVTTEGARLFLERFQGHQFIRQPHSMKRAAVSWARLQGFSENVDFYNSRRIAATDKKPWVLFH